MFESLDILFGVGGLPQNPQVDVDIAASKEHFQTVAYERAVRVRVPLDDTCTEHVLFRSAFLVMSSVPFQANPFQMGTAHELDDQPVREVTKRVASCCIMLGRHTLCEAWHRAQNRR